MDPGDAAQAAGNAASAAASEAGFPPEMIETAMNAGMESFQTNMDAGMPPGECMEGAMNAGMDAGSEAFGDAMPDFDAIGLDAFNEAIANGASPQEAGEAAGNAIETAATDFGMPPEMLEAGMNAAQDTFNDALANGASPEEAFGSAMEAGGNAADGMMADAGFDMADAGPMDGEPGSGPMDGEPGPEPMSGEPGPGPMGLSLIHI